ncbi:MAG: hypothetical protein A2516_01220 [Alphaproteobacteria bacterium RIFOXYD12_FULL_60_8]|nr:MAG: hypothetical protein A2516_01220 [Alphaproteobacteria bacterium RIFOXYD12_FULL_60_8]
MIQAMLLTLLVASANAEILILKDGSVLHGTINKEDADTVEIQTQDGTLQIKKDRIDRHYTPPHDASAPLEKINYAESTSTSTHTEHAEKKPWVDWEQQSRQRPVPAGRDLDRHSLNEISFNMGGFTPSAKLTLNGQDDVASPGLAYGGRYLRQTSAHAAFGIGFEKINPVMHNSETLITHAFTSSNFESSTVMGLAKLSTSGAFQLYVMGGLGFHATTLKIDAFPLAGYVWSDTGTFETRSVVNSTKSSAASMLQIGLDGDIGKSLSAGVELAYYYLGATTYDASPAAKQFGLVGINGAFAGVSFAGHFSARF